MLNARASAHQTADNIRNDFLIIDNKKSVVIEEKRSFNEQDRQLLTEDKRVVVNAVKLPQKMLMHYQRMDSFG